MSEAGQAEQVAGACSRCVHLEQTVAELNAELQELTASNEEVEQLMQEEIDSLSRDLEAANAAGAGGGSNKAALAAAESRADSAEQALRSAKAAAKEAKERAEAAEEDAAMATQELAAASELTQRLEADAMKLRGSQAAGAVEAAEVAAASQARENGRLKSKLAASEAALKAAKASLEDMLRAASGADEASSAREAEARAAETAARQSLLGETAEWRERALKAEASQADEGAEAALRSEAAEWRERALKAEASQAEAEKAALLAARLASDLADAAEAWAPAVHDSAEHTGDEAAAAAAVLGSESSGASTWPGGDAAETPVQGSGHVDLSAPRAVAPPALPDGPDMLPSSSSSSSRQSSIAPPPGPAPTPGSAAELALFRVQAEAGVAGPPVLPGEPDDGAGAGLPDGGRLEELESENASLLRALHRESGSVLAFARVRPRTGGDDAADARGTGGGPPRPDAVRALSSSEVGLWDGRGRKAGQVRTVGFDRVLGPGAPQAAVFRLVAPVARAAVDGQCACVVAYGITGSGKTHTMQGPEDGSDPGVTPRLLDRLFALVAKAREEAPAGSQPWRVTVSMLEIYNDQLRDLLHPSAELWLRAVKDAASSSVGGGSWRDEAERALHGEPAPPRLEIRGGGPSGRIDVAGLTGVPVGSTAEALRVLASGQAVRATAATAVHEHSSRSHMLTIVDVEGPDSAVLRASAHVAGAAAAHAEAAGRAHDDDAAATAADAAHGTPPHGPHPRPVLSPLGPSGRGRLASRSSPAPRGSSPSGSSVASSTVSVGASVPARPGEPILASAGTVRGRLLLVDLAGAERVRQSGAIAGGHLLDEARSINRSLSALGNVFEALGRRPRPPHVPYRDSKLTQLLQDAIAPSGRAVLLLTLSPSAVHSGESHRCLRFGQRARRIRLGPARRAVVALSADAERRRLVRALELSESRRAALERDLGGVRAKVAAIEERTRGEASAARASAEVGRRALAAELALARRSTRSDDASSASPESPDRTRELIRTAVDQARRNAAKTIARERHAAQEAEARAQAAETRAVRLEGALAQARGELVFARKGDRRMASRSSNPPSPPGGVSPPDSAERAHLNGEPAARVSRSRGSGAAPPAPATPGSPAGPSPRGRAPARSPPSGGSTAVTGAPRSARDRVAGRLSPSASASASSRVSRHASRSPASVKSGGPGRAYESRRTPGRVPISLHRDPRAAVRSQEPRALRPVDRASRGAGRREERFASGSPPPVSPAGERRRGSSPRWQRPSSPRIVAGAPGGDPADQLAAATEAALSMASSRGSSIAPPPPAPPSPQRRAHRSKLRRPSLEGASRPRSGLEPRSVPAPSLPSNGMSASARASPVPAQSSSRRVKNAAMRRAEVIDSRREAARLRNEERERRRERELARRHHS